MQALLAGAMVACSSKGESTGGYGVVDPMPTPARCSNDAAPHVKATATGAERPDGKWDVTVKVTVDAKDVVLRGFESVYSPNFEAKGTFTPAPDGGGTAVVTVDASSGSALIRLSTTCGDADTGSVELEVMWKVGHLKESPYPVTVRPR